MKQIIFFNIGKKVPFYEWYKSLDKQTGARVSKALFRLQNGSFGDCRYLGEGLVEMRLFFAGGIRIYLTEKDGKIIIILCGGDKKTQTRDITKAKEYLKLI